MQPHLWAHIAVNLAANNHPKGYLPSSLEEEWIEGNV
jgi:hypothetical protein